MPLDVVEVTSEVYLTITTHALTSETEEIMGLLLGDVRISSEGQAIARIWVAMPQIRTDRRKDRVEASPEQLAQCSSVAEKVSAQGGVQARVIGWYHSHPHITVLPSHVDLRTQASYQMLDEHFVGLIVSVFNEDMASKSQKMEVTAFQSVKAPSPGHLTATRSFSSQTATPRRSDSGHLPSLRSASGSLPTLPSQPPGSANWDESLAEAIRASKAEARGVSEGRDGTGWVRKEVRLDVVQAQGHAERTLTDVAALLKVLFQEEQAAYQQALAAAAAASLDGKPSTLAAIHHAAVYQQHLCGLLEHVALPAVSMVQGLGRQASSQSSQFQQFQAFLQQQQQQRARQKTAMPSLMDEDPLPALIAELQGTALEPTTQTPAEGVLPPAYSPYSSVPSSPHPPAPSVASGLRSPGSPALPAPTADAPDWPSVSGAAALPSEFLDGLTNLRTLSRKSSGALSNTPSKRPPSGGHRRTPSGAGSGQLDGLGGISPTAHPSSPQRLTARSAGSIASSPSWQTDPYAYGVLGARTPGVGVLPQPQETPQLLASPFCQAEQGPAADGPASRQLAGPVAEPAVGSAHLPTSQFSVATSDTICENPVAKDLSGKRSDDSLLATAQSEGQSAATLQAFAGNAGDLPGPLQSEESLERKLLGSRQAFVAPGHAMADKGPAAPGIFTRLRDQTSPRQSFETDQTAFSLDRSSAGDLRLGSSPVDSQIAGLAAGALGSSGRISDAALPDGAQQPMQRQQEAHDPPHASAPASTAPIGHLASTEVLTSRAAMGQEPSPSQPSVAGQGPAGQPLKAAQSRISNHSPAGAVLHAAPDDVRDADASGTFQYLSSASHAIPASHAGSSSIAGMPHQQHQQNATNKSSAAVLAAAPDGGLPKGRGSGTEAGPSQHQTMGGEVAGSLSSSSQSNLPPRQGAQALTRLQPQGSRHQSQLADQPALLPPILGEAPLLSPTSLPSAPLAQVGGLAPAAADVVSSASGRQLPSGPMSSLTSSAQASHEPLAGAHGLSRPLLTPPAAALSFAQVPGSSPAVVADVGPVWSAAAATSRPATGHNLAGVPLAASTNSAVLDTHQPSAHLASHSRQPALEAASSSFQAEPWNTAWSMPSAPATAPTQAAPDGSLAKGVHAQRPAHDKPVMGSGMTYEHQPSHSQRPDQPVGLTSPAQQGQSSSAAGDTAQGGRGASALPQAPAGSQQGRAAGHAQGAWQAGRPNSTAGTPEATVKMSEAERQFWAEAGMQPEDLRETVAERPASAGGSSASGAPLTEAEQQAFWAEAGITPEELGIVKAGNAQGASEAQPPQQGELAPHNMLNLSSLRRAFKGRKGSKSKSADKAKPLSGAEQ